MTTKLPWFRFYSEALSDKKLARVCRMSGQPTAVTLGVWVTLLCLANESPERGKLLIAEDMPVTAEELEIETGLDPIILGKLLDAFERLGMLKNGGVYTIQNWEKRQFKSDNSSARVARFRAKKKNKTESKNSENSTVTLQKRYSHVIDTDTDTERDKETTTIGSVTSRNNSSGGGGFSKVVTEYENNIGAITPVIGEEIGEAVDEFGGKWVIDAIAIAVKANARSWRYVNGVLRRWRVEGRNDIEEITKVTVSADGGLYV